jgi:hypothetical protein
MNEFRSVIATRRHELQGPSMHTNDPKCAGWLVWRLVSRQDSGHYPVDEDDQFDIRNDGTSIWNVLKSATVEGLKSGKRAWGKIE